MSPSEIFAPFATRLSYRRALRTPRRSAFSALARLSLMGVTVSMAAGCLIEDPPPYREPQRTRPDLDTTTATPPLDQVIVRQTGDLIEFKIKVVSEDAGDRLLGVLQLDMGSPTEDDNLESAFVPASTLDDTDRQLTIPWEVSPFITPGCHRFTLRVSHASNFTHIPDVLDPTDVAHAYWWANLNPRTDSATLENCPLASTGGP
jgi:hypothetical protein